MSNQVFTRAQTQPIRQGLIQRSMTADVAAIAQAVATAHQFAGQKRPYGAVEESDYNVEPDDILACDRKTSMYGPAFIAAANGRYTTARTPGAPPPSKAEVVADILSHVTPIGVATTDLKMTDGQLDMATQLVGIARVKLVGSAVPGDVLQLTVANVSDAAAQGEPRSGKVGWALQAADPLAPSSQLRERIARRIGHIAAGTPFTADYEGPSADSAHHFMYESVVTAQCEAAVINAVVIIDHLVRAKLLDLPTNGAVKSKSFAGLGPVAVDFAKLYDNVEKDTNSSTVDAGDFHNATYLAALAQLLGGLGENEVKGQHQDTRQMRARALGAVFCAPHLVKDRTTPVLDGTLLFGNQVKPRSSAASGTRVSLSLDVHRSTPKQDSPFGQIVSRQLNSLDLTLGAFAGCIYAQQRLCIAKAVTPGAQKETGGVVHALFGSSLR